MTKAEDVVVYEHDKVKLLAERLMGWSGCMRLRSPVDNGTHFEGRGSRSWNPFTYRDDAHECLAKLTDAQSDRLIEEMRRTAPVNTNAVSWYILTATPAQISEALVSMLKADTEC